MGNINSVSPEVVTSNIVDAIQEPQTDQPGGSPASNIDLLMDVSLRVTVELGRTRMQLAQILELQHGSVVELDRLAGDPVDIFVNDRMVARGEVVVVDDKFGVRITEMISTKPAKAAAG